MWGAVYGAGCIGYVSNLSIVLQMCRKVDVHNLIQYLISPSPVESEVEDACSCCYVMQMFIVIDARCSHLLVHGVWVGSV